MRYTDVESTSYWIEGLLSNLQKAGSKIATWLGAAQDEMLSQGAQAFSSSAAAAGAWTPCWCWAAVSGPLYSIFSAEAMSQSTHRAGQQKGYGPLAQAIVDNRIADGR